MSAHEPRLPEQRSPLAGVLSPGRYGASGADPLILREVPSSIVDLSARRGRSEDLKSAIRGALGLELPTPGRAAGSTAGWAIWIKPETWLVVTPREAEGSLARRVKEAAGGAASVVDQSHGKMVLHLSGAAARLALRKGCRLDLDPTMFGPGSSAVTQMAQIGCVLHHRIATPGYDLIVSSSYALPFFDWLCASAAEFGYEVQ